jgi:predicted DNA-binding ArsR family transcriptional regulator
MATHLLKENARMILGAWQVNQGKDEYLVVFSAPVNAAADAATLAEVIEVVTLSADRIEKELTGKDEY